MIESIIDEETGEQVEFSFQPNKEHNITLHITDRDVRNEKLIKGLNLINN